MGKGGLLSNDMKVACEIYRHNEDKNEPIWFSKLSEILENEMSRSAVSRSLDKLSDWGIVRKERGKTESGRAGRLLYIASEPKDTIKSVYEEFWKGRDPNDES